MIVTPSPRTRRCAMHGVERMVDERDLTPPPNRRVQRRGPGFGDQLAPDDRSERAAELLEALPHSAAATRPVPEPVGGVTGRAGPVRQSGRDQPVRARQRLGAGKLWRVGLGIGRVAPEQGRADRHRRLPVGHRVVDAPDDGPRAVLEGLDDVDRPERPIAGQPFRHQPRRRSRAAPRLRRGRRRAPYGRAGERRSSGRLPTPARRDRGESSRSAADSSARARCDGRSGRAGT